MWAGILNKKLEVHRFTKTKNEFGEDIVNEISVGEYRCGVVNQSTSRVNLNNEISFPYQKRFIVRRYCDIDEGDEILYNGKLYLIESIEENEGLQNKMIITTEKPV